MKIILGIGIFLYQITFCYDFIFSKTEPYSAYIVPYQSDSKIFTGTPLGYLFSIIALCKKLHLYQYQKKILAEDISRDKFLEKNSSFMIFEEQIDYIQHLLNDSAYGTLPEQIRARILLIKISLPPPYNKIMKKCLQRLYDTSFDQSGKYMWTSFDPAKKAYKKFYKKVLSRYKKLLLKNLKIDSAILNQSAFCDKVENEYNKKLLDIIEAGLQKNYPRLKNLCRKGYDTLVDKLYEYYEKNMHNFDKLILDESLSNIIVCALQYSELHYDELTQQLADMILKLLVLRDETWYQKIQELFKILVERLMYSSNDKDCMNSYTI